VISTIFKQKLYDPNEDFKLSNLKNPFLQNPKMDVLSNLVWQKKKN